MHNGYVVAKGGGKMAKSVGNVLTVRSLLEEVPMQFAPNWQRAASSLRTPRKERSGDGRPERDFDYGGRSRRR